MKSVVEYIVQTKFMGVWNSHGAYELLEEAEQAYDYLVKVGDKARVIECKKVCLHESN